MAESVVPKERVNIRYRPATGNMKEDVELPLKLLVVGDFTQKADERPVEERALANVNKDNFDEVLKSHNLSLDLSVPNRLSDEAGDEKMAVSLKFDRLKDFEPEAVVRQVPELKALLELREALVALKGPLGNIPAFRKMIQSVIEDEDARQRFLSEVTSATDKSA
ncbi:MULTISPECIES: type VI secretion system contractile sheath small subunit [unclassified Xanthobacter]|uniref:type VI secretion system contractile sheath small subunit n=1 Tax=unclassified Xanthobacter TaxID=2623496 RepID=UPI001F31D3A6|nr:MULTISPECIES: type VI secretion system contractile sheath small subunit [unclassified Xanthobacter]